jgi:hypothetical protein
MGEVGFLSRNYDQISADTIPADDITTRLWIEKNPPSTERVASTPWLERALVFRLNDLMIV